MDLNTVRLSYFSRVPPTNASCFVQRSIEGELDCKSFYKRNCNGAYCLIRRCSVWLIITIIIIISKSVCVRACVCVLQEVAGSDLPSSQMLLLLKLDNGDCRPQKGCPVRWQPRRESAPSTMVLCAKAAPGSSSFAGYPDVAGKPS